MSHQAPFTLSIPNAGTDSPALSTLLSKGNLRSTLGNSEEITIFAPAALTGVCTAQVRSQYGVGPWVTLQQNGADVAIGAGKAANIYGAAIEDLRIHSAGAEAAQRDFVVSFQIEMD
jgi:hypothetical protein